MTPKQTSLYWREWQTVHKRYPDIDRHELTIRALGTDKSSKHFTNQDLDKILGLFRSLTQPASLDAQLRQAQQDRTRLLWKIQHYQAPLLALYLSPAGAKDNSPGQASASERRPGLSASKISSLAPPRGEGQGEGSHYYIDAIARDKFHRPLSELTPTQLEQLRNTIAARLNTLRKTAGHTTHQMHQLATLKCPSGCAQCRAAAVPSDAPF